MNTHRWPEAFGRWLVRKRWHALLLIILLSILSGSAIVKRLQIGLPVDFTPQAIFFDDGPELNRLRQIESDFGREDNDLVVLLYGKNLMSEEGFEVIEQIHEQLRQSKMVTDVDSLYSAMVASPGLLTVDSIWEAPAEERLELLLRQPPYKRFLISENGDTTAIRARIDPSKERVDDLNPAISDLKSRIERVPLPDGIQRHITGVPTVRTEVVQMMMDDELFFIPLLAVIFAITICVLFRKVLVGLAPLFAVLIAIMWGMGLLLFFGVTLNVLSILVPTLALVIGVADGIHIITRYREELALHSDPETAMGHCMKHMLLACFLTTFTTAAGFCSLLVADTVVVRDFGAHAASMVMVAFVAVVMVVPCWLAFVPTSRIGEPAQKSQFTRSVFLWLDRWVRQNPKSIALGVLCISIGIGWIGSDVRPNSRLLEMYTEDHPTHQAITLSEERLSGVVPIFIHAQTDQNDLLEPDVLERLSRLESDLQSHDLVLWTHSFPAQIQNIHHLLTDENILPTDRKQISQELLMAEMSGELPLDGIRTLDYKQARILALCKDAGGRHYIEMANSIQTKIDKLFPPSQSVKVTLTGDGLMASIGIDKLITDLISSLSLVFLVIVLVLYWLLKDFKLCLIATLPNAIPLMFTLGTLAIIGADLQTSNVVSFTVAVGLAVDDTIHFIVRFYHERKAGQSFQSAITKTYLGAGHAIILTSALLVMGFGALASSPLTTTAHFGLLSAVTLGAAILADLLLLPALLHLAAPNGRIAEPL